jgi:hypothetical protein
MLIAVRVVPSCVCVRFAALSGPSAAEFAAPANAKIDILGLYQVCFDSLQNCSQSCCPDAVLLACVVLCRVVSCHQSIEVAIDNTLS